LVPWQDELQIERRGPVVSDDDNIGKRMASRTRVGIEGRYRTGSGIPRDVWITDLSKTGCRFYDRFGTMQQGKAITIKIGTVGPIPATVRWWDNHVNGVQFEQPLHDSVFEHICAHLSEHVPSKFENWED
jgi:hypothetical protein